MSFSPKLEINLAALVSGMTVRGNQDVAISACSSEHLDSPCQCKDLIPQRPDQLS
jgi:hypothetical protein